ncbi:MAG: hypothetical protein ABIO81_02205, partial [Ginsengibacter sp.]
MIKQVYHTTIGSIIFLIAGIVMAESTIAQLPQVKTSVDKSNILIGEQLQYKVETLMPDNSFRLTWFSLPDSFGSFVIVRKNKIDSTFESGSIQLSQEFTLTSFDSGRRVIPPLLL